MHDWLARMAITFAGPGRLCLARLPLALTDPTNASELDSLARPVRRWVQGDPAAKTDLQGHALRSGRTLISDAASANSGSWIGTGQLEAGRARLGMISREMYHKPRGFGSENRPINGNAPSSDTLLMIVYQNCKAAITHGADAAEFYTTAKWLRLSEERVPPYTSRG